MSFDHTAMVWTLIRADALPFRDSPPRRLTMLALADRTNRATGVVVASERALIADTGADRRTVQRVLNDLMAEAWLEIATPPSGRRSTHYRWTDKLSTAAPVEAAESGGGQLLARGSAAPLRVGGAPLRGAGATLRGAVPPNSSSTTYPVTTRGALVVDSDTTPTETALALVVAVESNLVTFRGPVGSPEALARAIATRVSEAYGDLLERPLPGPRETARAILAVEMPSTCPVDGCGALDAAPHLDEAKCSRRGRGCPYFVPELIDEAAMNGARRARAERPARARRHVEL